MEQEDLPLCMTIDQDFPEKASHCNMFFYLAQWSSIQGDDAYNGKKDTKGKDKACTKKIKGGKRPLKKTRH